MVSIRHIDTYMTHRKTSRCLVTLSTLKKVGECESYWLKVVEPLYSEGNSYVRDLEVPSWTVLDQTKSFVSYSRTYRRGSHPFYDRTCIIREFFINSTCLSCKNNFIYVLRHSQSYVDSVKVFSPK